TAGRADTGGGISTADGTFTVTRCTFDGNQATGPIGKGGAIYTKNGSVIVIGCTFSGNSADQSGGGIHSEAINSPRPTILSVADSSFLSNLAVGGGGISTVYPSTFSTCTVTNTTFDANRASSFGGAINGGGTIAGCTFVGNTAGQTAGAIWQSSGPSTSITESTFIANDPAAVVMVDAGRTTISSSTFRNNPGRAAGISLTHAQIS